MRKFGNSETSLEVTHTEELRHRCVLTTPTKVGHHPESQMTENRRTGGPESQLLLIVLCRDNPRRLWQGRENSSRVRRNDFLMHLMAFHYSLKRRPVCQPAWRFLRMKDRKSYEKAGRACERAIAQEGEAWLLSSRASVLG
jgi:hypothetical protein